MALVTFPLMSSVQYMCAKIGMVSGRGLAGVLKTYYSKKLLYPAVLALVVANAINAGADIGAIAAGVNLLLPLPVWALIIPIGIPPDSSVESRIPCVDRGDPWNHDFSLHVLLAVEPRSRGANCNWKKDSRPAKGATDGELTYAALDVNIGMLVSNVVMYFIILSTGATLFKAGATQIRSATDAAAALRPLAGRGAEALLAIGLIGAGFLAVPILTGSSAYAVAETFGWKHGLDRRPAQAKAFYALIALSTCLGMLINFTGINAVSALF